ncbi:MAG: hypothetical protein HGA44_19465 [Cellulomonadaceae bacterium]|nr:hypothetical protein [Cellulomonadaceae bacterium]
MKRPDESTYYAIRPDEAQAQVALANHAPGGGRFVYGLSRPGVRASIPALEWQLPSTTSFDWLWNVQAARLLSDRFRQVLEPFLGAEDHIQWLPARVVTRDGEPLPYWVAHFPEPLDIYDDSRTQFGPSGIPFPGRWTLSPTKVAGHHVFVPPSAVDLLIVTAPVAMAIRAAELTGLEITTL